MDRTVQVAEHELHGEEREKNMKDLLRIMVRALEEGREFVSAVVCTQSGSTPRTSGARMIVFADGAIAGSIGGGVVEGLAIKAALKFFSSQDGHLQTFNHTGNKAIASDMICGGRLDVFFEYVAPDASNRLLFEAVLEGLNKGANVAFLTEFGNGQDSLRRWALVNGEPVRGIEQPSQSLLSLGRDRFHRRPGVTLLDLEDAKVLVEDLVVPGIVYFVGAGHVAQCTAELAARVGFSTVVMDDRVNFANKERFPKADEIHVLSSFDDCFAGHTVDENCYLVIVTRGHAQDKTVLAQALATPAWYVGMIGSRSKRDAIYKALLENGVPQKSIDRVHCPIGLSIGADTPAEIAVSIVGELIQSRAQRRKPTA